MDDHLDEFRLFQIFKAAAKSGIIDMDQTSRQVEEMDKKKALENHPYAIYYREATDYWYTHLPDETKKEKRRKIKRKNRKDLEDAIVEFYESPKKSKEELSTLRNIYPKWSDYIAAQYTASTTVRRYDCDWRRWLENDPIVDKPLISLDYISFNMWAHGMVKGENVIKQPMTNKQYYNMITVVKGCLDFAVEKKVITENPFWRIKIKKQLFHVPKKEFDDDRDQVFSEDEFPELRELALKEYYETRDEVALAVYVISYTGMRAGEICALRWNSFNKDMSEVEVAAQVVKNEKRDADGNWQKVEWMYVDHTKSKNGMRNLYIPKVVQKVLKEHKKYKKPKSENDMVFTRSDGTYITNNQTYRRTVKYSNKIETYRKGTHKLRKTYLSALYDGGVHESTLTKIAGHAVDGKTLHKHYLKDRKGQDEVRENIEKILK